MSDKFKSTKQTFETGNGEATFYSLPKLAEMGYDKVSHIDGGFGLMKQKGFKIV